MWIENESVYGEIEPSKQFKWFSISTERIIHFKNSLSAELETQKLRINIIISAHFSRSQIVQK